MNYGYNDEIKILYKHYFNYSIYVPCSDLSSVMLFIKNNLTDKNIKTFLTTKTVNGYTMYTV